MQQQQPQQTVEHGREPCPDRILDDIGGAFGMGALGGGMWHTYRGLKNSPKGYKIAGALEVSWCPAAVW
jgi:import inner membrane translocase subunit TIM17